MEELYTLEDGGRKYRTEKNGGILWRRVKPTPGCNAKEEKEEDKNKIFPGTHSHTMYAVFCVNASRYMQNRLWPQD